MMTREPPLEQVLQRLDRLEGFLRADPDNRTLLADAFDTALQSGQWERAASHVARAGVIAPGDAGWALREGDLLLAQQRYDEASHHLRRLAAVAEPGTPLAQVVTHNLAYAEFRQGHCEAALRRLEPWMTVPTSTPPDAIVLRAQQLWLRLLHRTRGPGRACDWARQREQAGLLASQVAGVAALAAVDDEDLTTAGRWAGLALASQEPPTAEALVASSTLALALRDPFAAIQFADRALQAQPGDGRALSARAFARLLRGALPDAVADFQRAVVAMPTHVGTWQGLGWSQLLLPDLPGARASFEAALALDRNFAENHGALAVALALQNEATAAREHIELAQRLDRANLSSRYADAILGGESQDPQAMMRLAHRLLAARTGPLGGAMSDWLPADPGGHGT